LEFAGRTDIVDRSAVALICLIACATTTAAEDPGQFELTPFGGYRFGGNFQITDTDLSLRLDDAPAWGLLFNVRQYANTQWEVLYSRQETDASAVGTPINSSGVNLVLQTLQGGGTYQGDGETVRPYLAATIGGTHIEATTSGSSSDTFFSFSLGVGLQIRPYDRLGLRLEARGYGTLTDSSTSLFCQTGPDANVCAIRVDGSVLWQLETFAGVVFRF